MTQKKKKKKSVSSNRHGNLANTEAPKIQGQQKKKSIVNTKQTILFNQIIISNREDATQKFNQICKGKSIVEPSNNNNNTEQMDVDQISNGEEATQKFNLFNQSGNGEEATQKFNLSRCQQKKKKKKKKSVPPYQTCKGKSIMEPSNDNTDQTDVDQVMGSHFQEEIMIEILSRLPVRSLLQFKCVSKFWKALITDPYFKMKHHIHAKNDQNSQKFLISQMCLGKDDMFNFYCSSLSLVQVVEDEQKLDCPSNCKPLSSKIYCCCDGVVLLVVFFDRLDKHLLLWNPSTRESIVLPHPDAPLSDCVCGFGYDATSDDYKILTINLNASDCHNVSVEILALKSGSWRRIGKYPTGVHRVFGFRDSGMDHLAFVHGAFHWLGMSRYYTIISFNISNEVYGEIPLLERMCNIFHAEFIDHGVSVLGGMLCFYSTYNNRWEGTFKLWVMKDYGVKESWTELITIQDTNLFYSARPKHIFADGEVLLCCERIGCVGSVFRTSRGPFGLWPQCVTFKQGIVYTESLISPKLLT